MRGTIIAALITFIFGFLSQRIAGPRLKVDLWAGPANVLLNSGPSDDLMFWTKMFVLCALCLFLAMAATYGAKSQ
jgi:hypothetical protein